MTAVRVVAVVALASTSHAQTAVAALFDYDREIPLELEEATRENVDGVLLRDVSYRSPRGGRVTAYLVEPQAPGRRAGMVFVHWGQGDRTEFISEALLYAKKGAVSLLLDAPHMRPDFQGPRDGYLEPEKERETYLQLVVDVRRGLDLLLARGDVDESRLGYVGHSLGATWGGALAGVEPRVGAFVLMGGLPNLTEEKTSYPEEIWKQIRAAYSEEQIANYREALSTVSPERLVGRAAPGKIFFQFARYDRFISDAAAEAYTKAAREPEVRWYHTSHELNDADSVRDRIDWLTRKLALEP